jgi:hypothetical protein
MPGLASGRAFGLHISRYRKFLRHRPESIGKQKSSQSFLSLDLYKTNEGDIVVKPKGGSGTGEPTGYRVDLLKKLPGL